MNPQKINRIAKSLPFDSYEIVEADNSKGGLVVLWKKDFNWKIVFKSQWIIGVTVTSQQGICWSLWCCYCPAERSLKRDFWNNFAEAVKNGLSTWACIGDFNDLLNEDEKFGGREVSNQTHFFLKNFMEDLGGLDLGYHENTFTWSNSRGGAASIKERIDRVVASSNWRVIFNNARVIHLSDANSDHSPILLHLYLNHNRKPRRFHFLDAWSRDLTCEQTIQNV